MKVQESPRHKTLGGKEKHWLTQTKMELSYICITPKTKGCRILTDAIVEACRYDPQKLMVTKDLYPFLAKKYDIPLKNVERNIRSTIESAWKRARPEALELHCPELYCAAENRPTNGEFIQYYADKIRNG